MLENIDKVEFTKLGYNKNPIGRVKKESGQKSNADQRVCTPCFDLEKPLFSDVTPESTGSPLKRIKEPSIQINRDLEMSKEVKSGNWNKSLFVGKSGSIPYQNFSSKNVYDVDLQRNISTVDTGM